MGAGVSHTIYRDDLLLKAETALVYEHVKEWKVGEPCRPQRKNDIHSVANALWIFPSLVTCSVILSGPT